MAGDDLEMGEALLRQRKGEHGGAVARHKVAPAGDERKRLALGKREKAGGLKAAAERIRRMERAGGFANEIEKRLNVHVGTSIFEKDGCE